MYQALSDKDLEEYLSTGILPLHIRPTRCERAGCIETKRFNRHSCYARNSIYLQGKGWVENLSVQRFLCKACGKIISLIIPICYKWQRAGHALQQAVALGEPIHAEAAEEFSERTRKRWKQKWQAWTREWQQLILQWLLTWHHQTAPLTSRRQTRTPLGYLQALLDQASAEVPGAVTLTSLARFGGWTGRQLPHFLSLCLG
ncbi:MAG: hypothetical protein GX173_10410 [Ruminococcaceae bacterium]|jgi:hypothetical protein|nr:hypothetical protein [Oscillospiraceae bacterium]